MTLTLTIDGDRWRAHLSAVAQATPGLVPVAKGNGYGVGLGRRARTTQWRADQGLLGEDPVLAVGTYAELPEVATRCSADLLVLTPWRPFGPGLELDPTLAGRVIHTVGRPEDLRDLLARDPRARFVLELGTSMKRHGLAPHELRHTGLELADRPQREAGRGRGAPAAGHRHPPGGDGAAAHRRGGGRAAGRLEHRLGLAPVDRRAGPAAPRLPRPGRPTSDRHRPVAGRPRCAAGDRPRARRARDRAWGALRLPAAVGSARRPPGDRERRDRARHRARGPARRRLAALPRHPAGPGWARRRRPGQVAVPHRPEAPVLRRAAVHAGLDAVPAAGLLGAGRRRRAGLRVRFTATWVDRVVSS
ncbi:MAG: alanine racemase [Nocardioides sp.]